MSSARGSGNKIITGGTGATSSAWLNIWPYMVLFFVVVAAVTMVYIIAHIRSPRTNKSLVDYFVIISSIGIVFVLITIMVADLQRQAQGEQQDIANIVAQLQTNSIDLEHQFLNHPELLRMYKQMYPQINRLRALPDPPITHNVIRKEVNMIQELPGIIENVNLVISQQTHGWNNATTQTWLAPRRSWMRAPLVRQQWEETHSLWSAEANRFIRQRLLSQ